MGKVVRFDSVHRMRGQMRSSTKTCAKGAVRAKLNAWVAELIVVVVRLEGLLDSLKATIDLLPKCQAKADLEKQRKEIVNEVDRARRVLAEI